MLKDSFPQGLQLVTRNRGGQCKLRLDEAIANVSEVRVGKPHKPQRGAWDLASLTPNWGFLGVFFADGRRKGDRHDFQLVSATNDLPVMTRAGLEPATYGLKS